MKLRKRTLTGASCDAVTPHETENRELARTAAAEGFVLLKNEGQLLPLSIEKPLGLYGAGAVKTIKGGTGSGDVNERKSISIYQGMLNAGARITSKEWLDSYYEEYRKSRLDWKQEIADRAEKENIDFIWAYFMTPYHLAAGLPIDPVSASDGADTAVYVLSRIAGEGADRKDEEGDYFVSPAETAHLEALSEAYDHIVLVINTGGLADLGFIDRFPKIEAVIQLMQAGEEGGNAFADVLFGKVNPSGKLADTWPMNYSDYPNADTFSFKNGDVFHEEYRDGIFVGYRYFDTFDVPVRYSFGYGLSYTAFEIKPCNISISESEGQVPEVTVETEVKNTGAVSGKEVVQVYVSCPQNGLVKEYRRLTGYAKTKELKPGETQKVSVSFSLYAAASFDQDSASWILDEGSYCVWTGNSLADSKPAAVLELDRRAVLEKDRNICPLRQELEEIKPDTAKLQEKQQDWMKTAKELSVPVLKISADRIAVKTISYDTDNEELTGRAADIVNAMDAEQLIILATGDPGMGQGSALGSAGQTVPGAAAETSSAFAAEPYNVASIVLADGPAGLRLNREYEIENGAPVKQSIIDSFEGGLFAEEKKEESGREKRYQFCTAIPVGTLLAQTWNTELINRVGEMIGQEMQLFEVALWLAPGMNIHRNPLCGRNFEYYSEDPFLSGTMAAAMTKGVQSVYGCGTTIKHFACNNQEDNRMGSDSIISERALREIYLKGFEIAVKTAQPKSIMTSYNMINGVHAANCHDICTCAARDEWGFEGAVMTDWTTTTGSTAGVCTAAGCMRAGNDMVMPGDPADHINLREELAAGTLSERELRHCVYRTVKVILQSNQYEPQK